MKRSTKTTSTSAQRSQLRLIGGQWRGRKLPILSADGLRPTGDRIRETLFNWLAPDIHGARCLDLYAGSGALGLEALSRGASHASLVEANSAVAQQLRANCSTLNATQAKVVQADALAWLQGGADQPYDIVFLDPPFAANLWQNTIDALEQKKFLADDARIYIETPADLPLTIPQSWRLHRTKTTGAVSVQLYIREAPAG